MKKALGIVRGIDGLGRLVIPMEFRRVNGWEENQQVEMLSDNEGGLYIKAYRNNKDEEKEKVLEQLHHLINTSENLEVLNIASSTIELLKKLG